MVKTDFRFHRIRYITLGITHLKIFLISSPSFREELIAAKVLPNDYDFESHKELVPMQSGDVPVTYADTTPLELDFGFQTKH